MEIGRSDFVIQKIKSTVPADLKNAKCVNISGKIKNIEDKIPNITNLPTNTTLNAKINEVKNLCISV